MSPFGQIPVVHTGWVVTYCAVARTLAHTRNGAAAALAHRLYSSHGGLVLDLVMILPQVHLRKPCYDFYFL